MAVNNKDCKSIERTERRIAMSLNALCASAHHCPYVSTANGTHFHPRPTHFSSLALCLASAAFDTVCSYSPNVFSWHPRGVANATVGITTPFLTCAPFWRRVTSTGCGRDMLARDLISLVLRIRVGQWPALLFTLDMDVSVERVRLFLL